MAKRKRSNRDGSGAKLHPIKDYRSEQYTPYIFEVETGILETWTIEPDLRDGDVRDTLRQLMQSMKRSGELPPEVTTEGGKRTEAINLLEWRILEGLRFGFEKHGPLNVEAIIGILSVINHSVGTWNRGMRGQEYLTYIRDFLGGMGVEVREITEEEAESLLIEIPDEIETEADPPRRKKFLGLI
ncbi:MAG: hypothetical protein KDJ52_12230 [Anaerolineae bacterium]|nr:hypothetical protein [Anaerolineae bacterium]